MSIASIVRWNRLGLALSRIVGALRKEKQMQEKKMVDPEVKAAGEKQDKEQAVQAAVVVQAEKVVAEAAKPYSKQITVWKGALDLVMSGGAIAGAAALTAVLNWMTDNNALLAEVLGRHFSTGTTAILAMSLKTIGEMVRNWLKNRNREKPGVA